jgi:hypothetical protein
MRRLLPLSILLIVVGSVSRLLAQSSNATGGSSTSQQTDNATAQHDPAKAQEPAQNPPARQTPHTPGVRSGGVSITDKVTMGGYGSVR